MTAERWGRLETLFDAAIEMRPEDRETYLEAACGGDGSLRSQVLALVRASEENEGLFEDAIERARAELEPAAGSTIGPYEIVRELGRGGMGAVYLAVRSDDQYRKQVAIKLVQAGDEPGLLARFRAERQILADLEHPNIARLLDGGATGAGRPYIVMEYVDGEPLDVFCRTRGLPIRRRLRLFLQICDAVSYAHRKLVVHRDLKPGNILITGEGVPKLLDFGIAKLLESAERPAALFTAPEDRVMTPEYASPEQVRGEPVTTSTDVYLLGVLLFEVLTQTRPFRGAGTTPMQLAHAICEVDPEKPSAVAQSPGVRSELAGDLDNIVLMAMRKDAARRYGSADQLADDIRRFLDGFPVMAREPSWRYRAGKFVRRHRMGVAASAAFVVLLAGFAVSMALVARRLAVERDVASAERAKAQQVSQILADSFRMVDPDEARGNTVTAREILDREADRVDRLKQQPELHGEMLRRLGEVYDGLGLYDKSRAMLTRAAAVQRTLPRPDRRLDLAETLDLLGNVDIDKADYEAAESHLQEALRIRRAVAGKDTPEAAEILQALGHSAREQFHLTEAERYCRESLAILRATPDETRIGLTNALVCLGEVELSRRDLVKSESYYREAVDVARKYLGRDHPETVETVGGLAGVLHLAGKYEAARPVYMEALALDRRVRGEKHPDVARLENDFAMMLDITGDYAESERLLRASLETYRAVNGEEHPYVASAMGNLASTLHDRGEHAEERRLAVQALAIRRRTLGADHDATIVSMRAVARTLIDEGRYGEAESLMRDAIARKQKVAPGHPSMAGMLSMLGQAVFAQGRHVEAEKLLRDGVAIARKGYGENHPSTALVEVHLARCLDALGKSAEAEQILGEAIQSYRTKVGPMSVDLAESLDAMGQLLLKRGDARAEPLLAESLRIRKAQMAAGCREVKEAERVWGESVRALNRPAAAQ